ncbi:MAG: hypothetical protein ACJAVU_003345, partial [Cognaticolwellia sp.]
ENCIGDINTLPIIKFSEGINVNCYYTRDTETNLSNML